MIGPFRPTSSLSGGLLWKIPWRLSRHQKTRARKRLKLVDNVVATLDRALAKHGHHTAGCQQGDNAVKAGEADESAMEVEDDDKRARKTSATAGSTAISASSRGTKLKAIERWKAEMPTEAEMQPRDKYTIFDRKEKGYRKGVHKLPKWTRVSQRVNPPGY
ncbi:MAG: hypothetical protein M1837_003427 [Sclerophora amabilis]|nr:MAG: hypothetical protein M1837_003427 [Sclerophora amabilis]